MRGSKFALLFGCVIFLALLIVAFSGMSCPAVADVVNELVQQCWPRPIRPTGQAMQPRRHRATRSRLFRGRGLFPPSREPLPPAPIRHVGLASTVMALPRWSRLEPAADFTSGTASYYAWYEFYPDYAYEITGFTIHAGDQMSATVRYDGLVTSGPYKGQFAYYLDLRDTTTNAEASGDLPITTKNAARSSAEWILEAPTVGTQPPSPDFGSVAFTNSTAALYGGSSTSISGLSCTSIDMLSGSTILAHASALIWRHRFHRYASAGTECHEHDAGHLCSGRSPTVGKLRP